MSITKTRNLLGAVIFIILTAANAWGAGFTVQAPAAPQIPGNTFDVAILMDAGSYRVKSYRVKLLYDGTINKPLYAVHGDHPDFLFPMTNDVFFGSETKLVDFNKSYPDCSSGIPLTAVAAVKFLALEGAPSSSDATIKIVVEEVIDCSNNDVTSNFRTNFDGSVAIAPPVSGPTGVTQYLDLDGNGVFDYNDTVMMGHIVSGDLSNTYEMPFNIGGMQGDINGNGQVDFYDVGLMNAMSRDIVFCSTGFDGIAETLADPTDEQVIMPGQGKPNSRCISAGTNQVLESTVAGDDYEVDVGGGGPGNWMSSGLDGICDSLLSGDDVEEIPNGRGAPYSEMIKPGQDGELATPCDLFGDDQSHVFSKSVETLLNGHPVMGRPARLVKVSPTQEPVRIKQYNSAVTGTSVIPPVPLVVRIEDENGNPKPGLSPTFAVTMGSGVFDGPLGQTGIVDGVPSDGYMGMGQVPKGTSVVVFHPTLGINRVQVILPPDPTKGVPSTAPVIFDVVVDEATSLFPNIVTIQADTHNANLGEPVPVTINLANNTTPVPGLQDRIILLSQRNISAGFDADPTGLESPTANFMDDFENTVFPESPYGTWDVVGASINRDNSFPGLFGNYSLHIIGKGISNPISITHQVNNKNYYGIELSYEWSFLGITEDYDYFKVEYSTDNGVSWRTVQMAQGQQGLHCPLEVCDNVMVTEKRNLRGDDSADENSKFMIRFTFAATDAEEFWLDNVSVKGIHILWDENFESQAVGSPPTGFDSVDRITTGPDGIAQSAASGGDVQIIPVGQGKANEICIFPGLNNICDSTAGGDDQLDGAAGTISTGFNGICESTAVGDDFQLIPGGQGKPHTVAVAAGNDLYVDTPPGGDDELFTLMGTAPDVVVDDTVGLNPSSGQGHGGSTNFLKISRGDPGPVESYALRKIVNVSGMANVWLYAWTRSLQLSNVNGLEPGQKWLCEVSDNGGQSFIRIWDSSDTEENSWTLHKVCLSCDGRLSMAGDLIIQWRAAMDNIEDDAIEPDAAYIDDIMMVGTPSQPDIFGPIIDTNDGLGNYTTTITSLEPGTAWISAIIRPYASLAYTAPPLAQASDFIDFSLRKVDPNSVRVLPTTFKINACETMQFSVVGHYEDQPGTVINDITPLYDFTVNGPARITADGLLTADCFLGGPLDIDVSALPAVDGLYDPGGGGEGQQTGYIDGLVFNSTFPWPTISDTRVRILGSAEFSDLSDIDGNYFEGSVPVASNYTVQAMKSGWVMDEVTGVSVVSGMTTTENLYLDSGSDTDGDTVEDSYDNDDDNDGVDDSSESSQSTSLTDPDTDGDGVDDYDDPFPNNGSEWMDTDGDTIGDNTDTDDDGDGISDSEEVVAGSDGYITDPLDADTDGDTLHDGDEVFTYLTDPSLADTDTGGRNDGDEIALGKNPVWGYWYDDNTGPTADAGPDQPYAAAGMTVCLDGHNTTDPENDGIEYTWVQLGGASAVTIENSSSPYAYFDTTIYGNYIFSLQVKDDFTPQGWGTPDNVTITVGADSDGDTLSDDHETYLGSLTDNTDSDGDTISDLHDFWNSTTDIMTADLRCYDPGQPSLGFSIYCWGDTDYNASYNLSDIANVNAFSAFKVANDNVYPDNFDTADINGDATVNLSDIALYNAWAAFKAPISTSVASLAIVEPTGSPTVPIGSTQTVSVGVRTSGDDPAAGVGVLFTISGPGILMGGRGDAAGLTDPDGGTFPAGSRWDISGTIAGGGITSMVVKVTGPGTITINAKVPKSPSKGLSTTVTLSSAITINP